MNSNPTTTAARRYKIQLTIAMAAYVVILFAATWVLNRYALQGSLRYAVALLPLLPIAFLIPVVARYFRESDELERRIVTESFAIGAAVTALLSVTYGFLEISGLPHLSAWWTWGAVMGTSAIARIALNRRYE
jgi:hypothetical protein